MVREVEALFATEVETDDEGAEDPRKARTAFMARWAETLGMAQDTYSRVGSTNTRAISEYKAVASLERCTTDNRGHFKNWLLKLKNTLDQARGTEWRRALEAIELKKFTDDFEEPTDLDEKWDDWFQEKFGANRTDGGQVIDPLTNEITLILQTQ